VNQLKRRFFISAISIVVAGCTFGQGSEPPTTQTVVQSHVTAGRISIEVSTGVIGMSNSTARDRYWRYMLEPDTGRVIQTETGIGDLKKSEFPTGRSGCEKHSNMIESIVSPNGGFELRCGAERREKPAEITVTDLQSGKVRFSWTPGPTKKVHGFAWGPTSDFAAVLCYSQSSGQGVIDHLFASAGHPRPYMTFYLELIDLTSGRVAEYALRRDVAFGNGAILEWTSGRIKPVGWGARRTISIAHAA
jgi:hypothetical protein